MEAAAKAGLLFRAEEVFREFLCSVSEWHLGTQEDLAAGAAHTAHPRALEGPSGLYKRRSLGGEAEHPGGRLRQGLRHLPRGALRPNAGAPGDARELWRPAKRIRRGQPGGCGRAVPAAHGGAQRGVLRCRFERLRKGRRRAQGAGPTAAGPWS